MDKAVAVTPAIDRPTTTRWMRRWMRRGWGSLIQRQELVVFLLLQNKIVSGLTAGALK